MKSRSSSRTRSATVAAALALVVLGGCGGGGSGVVAPVAVPEPELEVATVAGLGVAVLTHVDRSAVSEVSGGRNRREGWMSVGMRVDTGVATVPLDTMVFRRQDSVEPGAICDEGGSWILSCQVTTASDGSVLSVQTSTEDIVGGRSEHGFFVFVVNFRDGEVVFVMEELDSREPSYLDLTELPVDVEVLKDIATDPYVGVKTTAELNDAGQDLPELGSAG